MDSRELVMERVQGLDIDPLDARTTGALEALSEWLYVHSVWEIKDDPRIFAGAFARRSLQAITEALGRETVDAVFMDLEPTYGDVIAAVVALDVRRLEAAVVEEAAAIVSGGDTSV